MTKFKFLLVLLLAKALAEEVPEPLFRAVGGELEMGFCFGVDYITLYKLTEKGKQLLGNSSNAAVAPPEDYRDRISPTNQLHGLLGMQVVNLMLSDSGVYLRECWRDNELVNHHKCYLYVCDGEAVSQEIFLGPDGGVDLVCSVSYSRQNNATIKWFKEAYSGYKRSLLLDTKKSQEPLQEELKGVIQVRDEGFSLHISEPGLKTDHNFFCLVMEGEQCMGFQNMYLPNSGELDLQSVFYGVGESAVLSCSSDYLKQRQVYWDTPLGKVNSTTTDKNKDPTGNDMYISKSKETGNYSLVIPSITPNHSGEYKCYPNMMEYFITVCSELKTNEIQIHTGSKVTLECAMTTDESANIQWYRQTKLEESNLIYDSGDPSLSTNTNIDILNTSLTISELTEEDSGMYWCVVLLDSTDYADDFLEDEDEENDETDDYWFEDGENTDNCILKQVTHLKVESKPTFTTKRPRNRMITDMDSTPEPDSESGTLLYAVIAVVGLVILLLIAVGVVLKLRARRRAADQSRTESSAQQTVSEPLVNLKSLH
ncbi:hypothetical protein SRHO_G00086340 [Serrasalmus rhombeus]